ncbi:MAG: hypothetical protein EZS28_054825, partial [Streblomastix strix]
MKQLARLMAENQIALRPSFERVAILRLRYKYPYGFTCNFDETPFRLRDDLSTYVFFTEDAPLSPTIAPPRAKNASIVPFVCDDGQHLTTFILWPAEKVPPELEPLISRDVQ